MEIEPVLLEAARTMDKEALVRIFDQYSSALYKYALRLSGDAMLADQIVGDVFAKLIEQLSVGNGPTVNLRSYLYEITYHRVVDEVRSSRRKAPLEVADWLPQPADSVHRRVEEQVLFQHVVRAICNELKDDQRHVIVLRFIEGFSLRETAAIVGKRVEHVKVIQGRAIAKLRRAVEHQRVRKTLSRPEIRHAPGTLGV